MKKEYIAPAMLEMNFAMTTIMAGSAEYGDGAADPEKEVLSKQFYFFNY